METRKAEAEAVAEIVRGHRDPIKTSIKDPEGIEREIILVPGQGGTMSPIVLAKLSDEWRTAPERRRGTACMHDVESFVAHVNRFKDADSAIFADIDGDPEIVAVLDYHRKGAQGAPRFGTHRTVYQFPLSVEWRAWKRVDGQTMDQRSFATFIEDHIVDVVRPDSASDQAADFAETLGCSFANAARLLDLSRGLAVNVEERVLQHVNLSTGEVQISFSEEHKDGGGGSVKVPGAFLVEIPLFENGAREQFCVRLRYRKNGPQLVWILDLYRADEVFRNAIRKVCEQIKVSTELPVLLGKPE